MEILNLQDSSFKSYFVDRIAANRARRYYDLVREGKPQVITSGMAHKYGIDNLKDAWFEHIKAKLTDHPGLLQFEEEMMGKIGPLSYMLPLSERWQDIFNYYECPAQLGDPIPNSAINAVWEEWGSIDHLRLRSARNTWLNMVKSTASGLPWVTKRKAVAQSIIHSDVNGFDFTIDADGKQFPMAAMLGWRGQEGGPKTSDVKQRVIWMFPASVNLQELRLYQVLISYAQRIGVVPAWKGNTYVDKSVTEMFNTKDPKDLVVCTDFTKFDQHFNEHCQQAVEVFYRKLFANLPDLDDWCNNVYPIKYNIPLLCSTSELVTGTHGMGSGSGGTNADETVLHRMLQHEAAMRKGQRLNLNSMCLGDDGMITYPGIQVEDVVETYASHGLDMNPSKQSASTSELIYLRRWYSQDYRDDLGICRGVYPTMRALGRLMYRERYYNGKNAWGPKISALRKLSILENCKYHPLFSEFVNFIIERDSDRLGLSIPGFLDNISMEFAKANDSIRKGMSYTQMLDMDANGEGIKNWAVVRLLKSMS